MSYYAGSEIQGGTTAVAKTGLVPIQRPAVVSARAGDVLHVVSTIIFANGTNIAINDVIEMLVLPADHVPVDFLIVADDLDSATTIQAKAGLMSGTPGDSSRALATVGTEILADASTTFQGAAAVGSPISAAQAVLFNRITPSSSDRSIGIGISAAPTNPATSRRVDLHLWYRWSRYGG
jgi:hypothetical protein